MPAGIENLFVQNPTLPMLSTEKLSDDFGKWTEELTTKLREAYPIIERLSVTVDYKKKDPMAGTAIGVLTVVDPDANKSILIPFIVRKFELFPLDVWMEAKNQAIHPLDNDSLEKTFFTTSNFSGLDTRPADSAGQYFNDPSTWTQTYPPLNGRYSYASEGGVGILGMISDDLRESDLDFLRNEIKKHAEYLPLYKKNGHFELIQKLAQKKAKSLPGTSFPYEPETNNFIASAQKLIPTSVAMIKKKTDNLYTLMSYADKHFDLLASEDLDHGACQKYMQKITGKPWDVIDLDTEGEKMVIMREPSKGVFLYDDQYQDKVEDAKEFAVYEVRNNQGVSCKGVVLPHVVDFNGKKTNQKIFVSAKGMSTIQPSIAGVKLEDSSVFISALKAGAARVGQTGTFIFIDKGQCIATKPVTISAIENWGPMTAVTLEGIKIKISRGSGPQTSMPSNPSGGEKSKFLDIKGMVEIRPKEYTIPREMMWIPMEGFKELAATPAEYLEKAASEKLTLDPITLRFTGIDFEITSDEHEKIGCDETKAKCYLAIKGAPMDKIATIIKKAKKDGKVKVHGLDKLASKKEFEVRAAQTYRELNKIASSLKRNLIKEASYFEDNITVDALLSLNFLNPNNLAKFVSYKPIFEKVRDYLAECLVAARLGQKDLPQAPITIAMSKLKEVCEGLEKIEVAVRKPETAKK